jgi:hypothetical protein
MIEFILDNLGIVLFVVIAIAARVLQVRAKARQKEEAPPPVFASGLEPDDDDGDDEARYRLEPDEAFIDYARTRGASAHAVEKARGMLENAPARFTNLAEKPVDLPFAAAPAWEAPADPPPPNTAPAPEASKKPPPLLGLKQRAPLHEAVLWAEILGKPRGMV